MTETSRRLHERSWDEVARYVEERGDAACVVVPVGAIEAHGRHAPLGADNYIADEIARRLAEEVDALVAPVIAFGPLTVGYDLTDFPGSISIRPATLTSLAVDVGTELGRHGFDPVVFVNGHGPNAQPLALAAAEINQRAGTQVGVIDWWTAGRDEITRIKGFAYGNHADEIETSLVLASEGAAHVDLARATRNPRELDDLTPEEREVYLAKLTFTHVFDERWVGDSGNMGDPTRASAEAGEAIVAATVALGGRLVTALRQERDRRRDRRGDPS